MKFQAEKYSRKELKLRRKDMREKWHRKFAFLPVAIPEAKYDEIVVPRHYVWLERYAYRYEWATNRNWKAQWKSYAGELSLRALVRQ